MANSPSILAAGMVGTAVIPFLSPATYGGEVVFPTALPGDADKYCILLTTLNGGYAYVSDRSESGGNFTGFSFRVESECDCMYLVVRSGFRFNIV